MAGKSTRRKVLSSSETHFPARGGAAATTIQTSAAALPAASISASAGAGRQRRRADEFEQPAAAEQSGCGRRRERVLRLEAGIKHQQRPLLSADCPRQGGTRLGCEQHLRRKDAPGPCRRQCPWRAGSGFPGGLAGYPHRSSPFIGKHRRGLLQDSPQRPLAGELEGPFPGKQAGAQGRIVVGQVLAEAKDAFVEDVSGAALDPVVDPVGNLDQAGAAGRGAPGNGFAALFGQQQADAGVRIVQRLAQLLDGQLPERC